MNDQEQLSLELDEEAAENGFEFEPVEEDEDIEEEPLETDDDS